MSLRSMEAEILRELKRVSGNSKIRQKDIMEWRTGEAVIAQGDETNFYLPELRVSVAVILPKKKTEAADDPHS